MDVLLTSKDVPISSKMLLIALGFVLTLSFVIILLAYLPFSLTVFIVFTVCSFIAFHWSQNPASVSRAFSHVRSLVESLPEFGRHGQAGADSRAQKTPGHSNLPSRFESEPKLTQSAIARGKENIVSYVRPILKPRRFGRNTALNQSEFQGHIPSPNSWQDDHWVPLKNSTALRLGSPHIFPSPGLSGGINSSPGFAVDDKSAFGRLPLSPIYPPNKTVAFDSPELDLSSTMMRFNSGQDSLLHPSMHYPTHQPDLIASPGLLPSASWLREGQGGVSASGPRQRRGLPRVQSPVMVKIASPMTGRPASPLFRKLAVESSKQKASRADEVINAIKLRQKRSAQEANSDASSAPAASEDVKSQSKRRRLESTAEKGVAMVDIDMDLNPLPRRPHRSHATYSSRFGITSPTPRNPIESSVSSSKRVQGMLKRRADTNSVEVEEEDGISPIKKRAIPPSPPLSQVSPPSKNSPSRQEYAQTPIATGTKGPSLPFSPFRATPRQLHLERRTSASDDTAGKETPAKSGLKGRMFTPVKPAFVPRVDTPGEYTAADSKEDRAHAKQRGSYLKEMLMQETDKQPPQGPAPTSEPPKSTSLLASSTTMPSASSSLPSLSVGPLKTAFSATPSTTTPATSAAATTSSASGLLGALAVSAKKGGDNPLLSASDKLKLTATNSEKGIGFGSAAPPVSFPGSVSATSLGQTQKTGDASAGFKLPTPSATIAPSSSAANGFLSPPSAAATTSAGITQVDTTKGFSINNNAAPKPQEGSLTSGIPLGGGIGGGGFTLGGLAPGNGGTTKAPATEVPGPKTSATPATQQQFKPIFGGALETAPATSAPQKSLASGATLTPGKPASTAPTVGGFQFGQKLGTSTTSTAAPGGFTFGSSTVSSTTAPGGLTTPFPAGSATTPFPAGSATTPATSAPPNKSVFPATSTPASTTSQPAGGGPQFPTIFGQTSAVNGQGLTGTTTLPGFGGAGQAAPASSSTQQQKPGGFSFGQTTPSTGTTAPPPAFNFGGGASKAAAAPAGNQPPSIFGGAAPPAASPFGTTKPATTTGMGMFGTTSTLGTTNQAPMGGATSSSGSIFGGASTTHQAPAFGSASSNSTGGIFGATSTPGAQPGTFAGTGGTINKPAFGNPTATVAPFGSGSTSQPAGGVVGSPFAFGGSQPSAPSQPTQSAQSGGFNFGAQATPQKNFSFGQTAPSAATGGFQFGTTPGAQPAAAPSQQTSFFSGAAAPAGNQFGASTLNFGGPSVPGVGVTPSPAFGAAPSPSAAPAGAGFSIGAGGNNNTGNNQRRMNRLRQVRSRAGRR